MLERYVLAFEHISSLYRALILAGGLTLFWLLEGAVPLFVLRYNKWKHAGINLFFTLTTIVINFAFALLIVAASKWCLQNQFGLLQWLHIPFLGKLILGLLMLDLIGAYVIHLIEHKVKWMWRFHMIHHADNEVDTTTANRHHPVESIFRAVFTLLAVIIAGCPMWLVILYQSLSVFLSQFNHANIRLPVWLDAAIACIVVSPNMHKVHLHYKRPQTDTNYGNIFSFWDRLFGTYISTPVNQVTYGLDVLEGRNSYNIKDQLALPFNHEIETGH